MVTGHLSSTAGAIISSLDENNPPSAGAQPWSRSEPPEGVAPALPFSPPSCASYIAVPLTTGCPEKRQTSSQVIRTLPTVHQRLGAITVAQALPKEQKEGTNFPADTALSLCEGAEGLSGSITPFSGKETKTHVVSWK